MTKFLKRIQKSIRKDVSNVVVVGYSDEYFTTILESFKSIFFIDNNYEPPKSKNIIPIKDISFLNDLQEVDIIFINQGFDINVLQFLLPLSKRTGPDIFLNEEFIISKEYIELFIRMKYEQITFFEKYQVWKLKRK